MEHSGIPWHIILLTALAVAAGSFVLMALAVSFVRFQLMTDHHGPESLEGGDLALQRKILAWIGSLDREDFSVILICPWLPDGQSLDHEQQRLIPDLIQQELRADDIVLACDDACWGLLIEAPEAGVTRILDRMDDALTIAFAESEVKPGWRIGVARFPDCSESASDLYQKAKAAHEQAVATGATRVLAEAVNLQDQEDDDEEDEGLKKEWLDPLTGVLSPEHVPSPFRKYVAGYRRENQPVSIVHFDIDRLSLYNKQYDQACGDQLIREVAEVVQSALRDEDLMGRYGVDSFVIALGTTPETAVLVAQRLHSLVKRHVFDPGRRKLKLTISSGVAGFPDVAGGAGNYLDASERALRLAKVRGGDVCLRFDMSMLRVERDAPADVL